MISQKMFAEEQHIRDVLGRLRTTVLSEQERYNAYRHSPAANAKAVEAMKGKISVYTETFNLMTGYLTDYTVNLHGVLKYVRQAEEEAAVAKRTLLYLDKLHEKKTKREAALLAEHIAYKLMGEQVDVLEPQLRALWSEAVEEELALYERMVQERRGAHA